MKMLALHVAAISVLLAGAASAADLRQPVPVKSPAPVPVAVYNWTGCYVGAGGGYGMVNQDTQTFTIRLVRLQWSNEPGGRGWFGTVQVGCDYQIGPNIVIGAFGDYDFGNISGDIIPPVYRVIVGEERLRLVVGGWRANWLVVVPQLLAYVSGGYTQAHFNLRRTSTVCCLPTRRAMNTLRR